MFVDENSIWPRPEPERRPERPRPAPADRPARLFLILAVVAALLPFSPATIAALIYYLAGQS